MPDAVESALDQAASRMTPLIRNRALEAGWPEDVAARLSMVRTVSGIGISYEGNNQEVEDLEYGSPSKSPKSVLTTFETPATKKEIDKIAEESMGDMLGRIDGMLR